MKIYVGHSREFDFEEELYKPLKEIADEFEVEFIFPHEGNKYNNSRETTRNCDLMIAEITYSSTGLGIEMGWVNDLGIPIICLIKSGKKIPDSIRTITNKFLEYENGEDLKGKVGPMLKGYCLPSFFAL